MVNSGRYVRPLGRRNPTAEEIQSARAEAGLTQAEAAALIDSNVHSWRHWEQGKRLMHPAFWRLFLIETEQQRV